MKWSSILALSALLVVSSACEKHPASQLPPELRGEARHGEAKHETKPAKHPAEAAKPAADKPAGEAKPGEAPKFFPETK